MKSKKYLGVLFGIAAIFGTHTANIQAAETTEEIPALVEAKVVTEVLDWGETVTALRLEYSDEIDCRAIEYSNEHPGKMTYQLVNDRDIISMYVNNSGEKDDVDLQGKYVFINLGLNTEDYTKYRDQVVFNTTAKTRDEISAYYLLAEDIETVSGETIEGGRIATSGEIRLIIDDFNTETFTDEEGNTLYYHLYIPEGYENKSEELANLPLVVHYPSGDYSYQDYDGTYKGALFTHPDCTLWASEEAQEENPAFVITVGGESSDTWNADFEESWMQQAYLNVVEGLKEVYNIDPERIYAISLAGGSVPMWNTILANPDFYTAQVSTAYDFYHAYKDVELGEQNLKTVMDAMPGWFFAGLTDGSGAGCLGEEDTRTKGERLLAQAEAMQEQGISVDIAYGESGELMWNGLLRGEKAEEMAKEQVERANGTEADHLFTLYIPGTIQQTMHWSWNATYSNAVVRDWLFSQTAE